jgi:NAD(P)-dependent dehydrogenase (short-subunit alcohol dehydrogenase family)
MLNDVKGVANVVRHFAPGMLDRRTRGVPGRGDFAAVVNVTHVLDPPEAAQNAAYRASRAAIGALTAALASELADHFHPGGNDGGGGGAVESRRSNSNANARRDRSASANSRVVAVELDPGAMPGLVWPSEGADVGPTHYAKGDAAARDWARAAVPFILGLTPEVTGASLHVPGFPPG